MPSVSTTMVAKQYTPDCDDFLTFEIDHKKPSRTPSLSRKDKPTRDPAQAGTTFIRSTGHDRQSPGLLSPPLVPLAGSLATGPKSPPLVQCLPQIRSPKKQNISLEPDQVSDIHGLTGASPERTTATLISQTSEFDRADVADIKASKRLSRPRIFGFTEMVPDSPCESECSSKVSSAATSRDTSPERASASGEIIPRTKRFNGSLDKPLKMRPRGQAAEPVLKLFAQDVTPKATANESRQTAAVETPVDTSVAVEPTSLSRRTSLTRSQSELGLRQLAPVKPARAVPLGSRTSAQRNESALKLDLKGIRDDKAAVVHDPALNTTELCNLKSALLRKKSGEVVKPALKSVSSYGDVTQLDGSLLSARSAPTTPGTLKNVHFDAQLERVKLFLHDQKPKVVSRNGSPTAECTTSEGEDFGGDAAAAGSEELGIALPNFPRGIRNESDVLLESIALAQDKQHLKGTIKVRNIAFQKWVAVRFTIDWWQTTNETSATYLDSLPGGEFDRFQFSVRLSDILHKIEQKNMFICVRYLAGEQEVWDNNGGSNYHVTFNKSASAAHRKVMAMRNRQARLSASPSMGRSSSSGRRQPQWDQAIIPRQDKMADLRNRLERASSSSADQDDRLGTQGSPSLRGASRPGNGRQLHSSRGGGSADHRVLSPRVRDFTVDGNALSPSSPQAITSPLASRYDFDASLKSARGGGKSGRSTRALRDGGGPLSPGGMTFASDASVGPSMEFYSPQLSSDIDLPSSPRPDFGSRLDVTTPTPASAAKPSLLSLDTIPPAAPVLKVQEPSPPVDYFSSGAPAHTSGPMRSKTDSAVPTTSTLPRQYSQPPFPLAHHDEMMMDGPASPCSPAASEATTITRENATITRENALGLLKDHEHRTTWSTDFTPPSMAGSIDSSCSDSPDSPVDNSLPPHRSSSADDINNMSYKAILEQFCWVGDQKPKSTFGSHMHLDDRRNHSTGEVDKFFINHFETMPDQGFSSPPLQGPFAAARHAGAAPPGVGAAAAAPNFFKSSSKWSAPSFRKPSSNHSTRHPTSRLAAV